MPGDVAQVLLCWLSFNAEEHVQVNSRTRRIYVGRRHVPLVNSASTKCCLAYSWMCAPSLVKFLSVHRTDPLAGVHLSRR